MYFVFFVLFVVYLKLRETDDSQSFATAPYRLGHRGKYLEKAVMARER